MMPKYNSDGGDLLDILAEEAAELIKEIMKARRFGLDGMPEYVAHSSSPRDNIINELGDLLAIAEIIRNRKFADITWEKVDAAIVAKKKRLLELFGLK